MDTITPDHLKYLNYGLEALEYIIINVEDE
jgi:hypothetical protein